MLPGERLRAARDHVGWTQARLADEAGLSKATISAYELGRLEPHRSTMRRLLRTLACATPSRTS